MESLKIILVCILAAIVYGILHDQFTARICLEYFTVFHPPVFATQSPTLLAFGWGVIATWWVGAGLGIPLALASRLGRYPKLKVGELLRPILTLLGIMAVAAVLSGVIGYYSGALPYPLETEVSPQLRHRFAADLWAHNASYLVGFLGGITLCVYTIYRRRALNPIGKTIS